MIGKLESCENRFDEVEQKLTDPIVISNTDVYRELLKEHAELLPTVTCYREYKRVESDLNDALFVLDSKNIDPEMKILAQEQLKESKAKLEELKVQLKELMMPKDPNDDKNVIVEIRGGAGGEEASLFAADLFRMYSKYSESKGYTVSVMDVNETELGGLKEIVFTVEGNGAYSRFKYESGVHRVQRVPETESQGRVHTSTVTVAVLPEVDDVQFELDMNDVDVDTYRSGGAGGQHINKTDSAIRLTHRPTGIVVTCQDQRSQLKNKEKAIKVLKARLLDKAQNEQSSAIAEERKSQVGTGDRSERIRTYNFPQNRITDHRIDLTIYNLTDFIEGRIEVVVDSLITADRAKKLSANNSNGNEDF